MATAIDSIRVLHVDDDPGFADVVREFLEREDDRIAVHTAADASEALAFLEERPPDCVVSDYEMPGWNGIELLERIREDRPDLPFILYTGKGSEEVAADAISAGVTDYLQKKGGTDQYAILANRVVNAVERYRIEREAEHTRTQLRAISENSADAIVILDGDSRIHFANPAVEDHFGYAPSELQGEPITTIMPERFRADHVDALDRYLRTGERSFDWSNVEFPGLHRDGTEIPLSISFGEFEQDGAKRFVGIIRDVSERTRMEEALRERERRFRQLAENIEEVVWMSDIEGDEQEMIYVNPAYEEIWGRPAESLYDETAEFLDTVHPDDRERVSAALETQASGEYEEEYRIVRPDGEVRWVWDRAIPVENDAGEVYRLVGVAADVTERKRQKRRLETLISNLPGVVYRCRNEPGWPMELVRGECEPLTGYPAEAIVEGEVGWGRDVIHPDDQDRVWETVQDALAGPGTFELTYRIRTSDGDVKWVWERGQLVDSGRDDWTVLEGFITGVTERKEHERELQQVRNRMEFALDATDALVWDWDVDADQVRFYPSERTLYGRPIESFDDYLELVAPADRGPLRESVERALDTGTLEPREIRISRGDGEVRWVEVTGRLLENDDGPTRMIGVARDVTDRKRREQRLQKQQAFSDVALESVLDFYWVLDMDGYVVDWSDEDGSVTGYTPAEAVGMHATDFFPEDEREYIAERVETLQETGAVTAEANFRTNDGELVPYRFDGTVILDDEENVERMCGFGQDVSERVERERQLREERDLIEQLTQTLPDIFYLIGPDMTLRRWNDRLLKVTGYSADEVAEMEAIEFFAPEDRSRAIAAVEEARDAGQAVVEAELVTADGDRIPYEFTAGWLDDARVDITGFVGIGRDISERKRYEQQLERQNRRLDRFASLVSHDLRNPLEVAHAGVELTRTECDSEHLDEVERGLDRMETIIDDLLTLARAEEGVGDREPVDLDAVVAESWETVETGAATLVGDVDRSVRADRSRLKQLFENLVRNSVEHGGSTVTVTVGELDGGFFVEDDGPGINHDEREAVFEPGYSTAERSTGFGLNIVTEIADAHGWEVAITEGASGGARFEVTGVDDVAD